MFLSCSDSEVCESDGDCVWLEFWWVNTDLGGGFSGCFFGL